MSAGVGALGCASLRMSIAHPSHTWLGFISHCCDRQRVM